MAAYSFEDLARHVGHDIEVVFYGDPPVNVAVECETCCEVLLDFDKDPPEPYLLMLEEAFDEADRRHDEAKIEEALQCR